VKVQSPRPLATMDMDDERAVLGRLPEFSEDGGEDPSASTQTGGSDHSCAHPLTQPSTEDRAIGTPACTSLPNEPVTWSTFRTLLNRVQHLAVAFNSGEATSETFVQEIYQAIGDVCKLMEATGHRVQETLAGIETAQLVAVLCDFMKNVYCRKCYSCWLICVHT